MDNTEGINVWEISRRLLFTLCPAYFFLSLFWTLLTHLGGYGYFIQDFIVAIILIPLGYIFIVIPIVIFKPVKSFNRRTIMIISSLIFTLLSIISIDLIFHPEQSLSHLRFSKNMIINGQLIFLLGCGICYWFYHEEKQYITEKRTIKEQEKRINNEKMITETYLRLLQAQIEPHFLFNTLTSILSLTDTDLQKAKKMHDNFMQYLKTTLSKTRSSVTTIAQEIELIKAYLDIFKVRMGKRLHYTIETDDEVNDLPFPSMLIQPIVENAIKHGLEPKIEDGEIRIEVTKGERDRLFWEIEDTGLGMSEKSKLGTGLSNIMERIEALYGKEGSLRIKENQPSGVKVILEVPYV